MEPTGEGQSGAGRVWLALCFILLFGGCAGPNGGLWPPERGTKVYFVTVSVDAWHTSIALPAEGNVPDQPLFEEWGYQEQAWTLENRQGFTGFLRVLFSFSPGVVEVGRHEKLWAERTTMPPSDVFFFRLSEEGYQRLRRYLQDSIASSTPVLATEDDIYYPARPAYNLFFNQCHQYAARALREAGLPVSVFWAISRAAFAEQLAQAAKLQDKVGVEPRNGGPIEVERSDTRPSTVVQR